jgi:hypothetical protein
MLLRSLPKVVILDLSGKSLSPEREVGRERGREGGREGRRFGGGE